MAHLIPDLVGFTDNRAYDRISYVGITRSAMVLSIVNTLVSVGWTVLSGPTATTHGNEYELYSQQAPWYDHDNIPAWYLGGRVYLKIEHPTSASIGFQVGEYYNSTISNPMTGTERITINPTVYTSNTGDFFVIGNPYECYIGIDKSTAPSNTEFYCGTLNVPKAIQQRELVVSSIIADRFRISSTMVGSTLTYSLWRTKAGVTQWFGNPTRPSSFLTVTGGNNNVGAQPHRTARRIWRRDRDSGQTNPQVWEPFPLPAQVSLALTRTGTPVWRGFMWDAMIISENATQGSYFNMINKSWYCYGSGTSATDRYPASLWLNIGPEDEVIV